MHDNLMTWAHRNGINRQVLQELFNILNVPSTGVPDGRVGSEEAVQAECMITAAKRGCALWRNNSGVLKDETGRSVRFGLGNTSSRINEVWKSADLIGILPMLIEPKHVGYVVGRFWAVECKHPGWRLTDGDKRGQAQLRFLQNVNALGGQGQFAQSVGDLPE